MNPRCLVTALATLMALGVSAPAAAQSEDYTHAAPDARALKAAELASEW